MKKRLFIAFCSLFAVFSSVAAGEFRIISAEELKKTMDTKKQVMLVSIRVLSRNSVRGMCPGR